MTGREPSPAAAEHAQQPHGRGPPPAEGQVHGEKVQRPGRALKDLLSSAPLEGVDLRRPADAGRPVEL